MNREEYLALKKAIKHDFGTFVGKCFKQVTGGQKYLHNFHIDVISHQVNEILEGRTKRLIVNLPPRNLKSICFSVALPAFLLGHRPNTNIVCVSYNQDLADSLGRDCLSVMQSEWYKEIFPQTIISKKATSDFSTTKQGGRLATGIEGTLTGRGGDFIIIDDPLKPDEAASDLGLKKVNTWYTSTLISRLNNKEEGVIINVMQRLHENDLTGHLLTNSDNWVHLKMPAIAIKDESWNCGKFTHIRKAGEALHPERDSIAILEGIKKDAGSYIFAGQYQQEPAPLEGGLVKRDWLKYYDTKELPFKPDCIILSWDTACKTGDNNDFSVCTTWYIKTANPRKYYLQNVYRGKLEYPNLLNKVIDDYRMTKCHNPDTPVAVLVEDSASGTPLLQELIKMDILVHTVRSSVDKKTRLMVATPLFERGQVLLPKQATWLDEYISELLKFPNSKFDDQVDSTTQALMWQSGNWNFIIPGEIGEIERREFDRWR